MISQPGQHCTHSRARARVQGTSVEKWVEYGLGLPQYRDAFARNGVTVLDFPLFLEDESLLSHDLGVANRLHRQQMVRAMQSLVLGQGSAPAPVRAATHEADSGGGVTVAWRPPEQVRIPDLCLAGPARLRARQALQA